MVKFIEKFIIIFFERFINLFKMKYFDIDDIFDIIYEFVIQCEGLVKMLYMIKKGDVLKYFNFFC